VCARAFATQTLARDADNGGLRDTARVPEVAEVVTPALARLEGEIADLLDRRRDELARQLARIVIGVVLEERQRGRGRNGRTAGPRLCARGCGRLAARARTVCESCRKREQRERARLRETVPAGLWLDVDELERRSPAPREFAVVIRDEVACGRVESDGNGRVRLRAGALDPEVADALAAAGR
jgi:hypothetical protein